MQVWIIPYANLHGEEVNGLNIPLAVDSISGLHGGIRSI